jgi:hypothetical protein
MAPNMRVGLLQGFDEAQRGSLGVFGQVVRDGILDILLGLLAGLLRRRGLALGESAYPATGFLQEQQPLLLAKR